MWCIFQNTFQSKLWDSLTAYESCRKLSGLHFTDVIMVRLQEFLKYFPKARTCFADPMGRAITFQQNEQHLQPHPILAWKVETGLRLQTFLTIHRFTHFRGNALCLAKKLWEYHRFDYHLQKTLRWNFSPLFSGLANFNKSG